MQKSGITIPGGNETSGDATPFCYIFGVAKGVPIARNAGSLSPLASKFDRQRVLAIDQYNNIYVTDTFYHRIQKWGPNDSDGTTIAGGTRN
ncbi:unnamed protein product, partial [Rotaria sp. Silwood1]